MSLATSVPMPVAIARANAIATLITLAITAIKPLSPVEGLPNKKSNPVKYPGIAPPRNVLILSFKVFGYGFYRGVN